MRTRICPKCGGSMSGPKYENYSNFELLRFSCLCGYSMTEATLDNQPEIEQGEKKES